MNKLGSLHFEIDVEKTIMLFALQRQTESTKINKQLKKERFDKRIPGVSEEGERLQNKKIIKRP